MDTNINSMSEKYITKIGSFSGATRASTGYTFINIQKQSDDLVKLLPNINSMKTKKNFHPLVLRKMDDIFLNIVSENPNYMKNALMNLFDSKYHESQIRFLSDTPSILDIFKIIFYLPKIEFLKYSFGFGEKNGK
jgi:lycopene beta-cyclase